MTELNPDKLKLRAVDVFKIVGISVAATLGYVDLRHQLSDVRANMDRDLEMRAEQRGVDKAERDRIVQSVDALRAEMRNVFVDSVNTRQAQQWIEQQRMLHKNGKYADIIWSDLPR